MDGMIATSTIRDHLIADIAATAERHDSDGSFPFENFERLHEENLLALTVREQDGGQDADLVAASDLVGAVGAACPSTALVLAMQLIHTKAIARSPHWPEHLKTRIGRSAACGGALINALRVEPALGTPARGGLPATTARRTAAGWVLNGRKIYATGAPGLTHMLVWARTDEVEPRVGFFLAPARAAGVRIVETWDHLGLRASGSHDVLFNDVEISADDAGDIRAPAAWARRDPLQAAWNAAMIGALYTGVARAARDWLVWFLNDRAPSNLGAPLATLPRMQEAVGGIEALLATNARLIRAIAVEHDQGVEISGADAGLLKTVIAENAIQAVETAVKLTGNHGLARANPLQRHLRDVLCSRIHTPQQDSAHIAAGRAALGQQVLGD